MIKLKINKFKLLFIYKSFIFRFVEFYTDSCDIQDKIIINALNIKNRKKRIDYIYNKACLFVDEFYNNENICGFINNKCYVQRRKNMDTINGCCRCCKYIGEDGCSTCNLTCKLFSCSEVYSRRKVITHDDLKILKVLSIRQRVILKSDYFSSKEDVLKDLYSYSIMYSGIRIIYRLIFK